MTIKVCRFVPVMMDYNIDNNLNERQIEMINFIEDYKFNNKRVPTYVEIGEYFNVNTRQAIHQCLLRLKAKGYNYDETNKGE